MAVKCVLSLACAAAVGAGCSRPVPLTHQPSPFQPVALGDRPGLHNLFRLTDRLYSGSGPESEAALRSLRELGVTTIVSVDGARPGVELARRHGLRYSHLPVGYDGVPRDTALAIARVVRDSPGPVYVHCHHGKHRGPAAAIAAARCLDGGCDTAAALAFLAAAGTDPRYKGLFADVGRATGAEPGELDRVAAPPEVAAVPDLTRLMVAVDERWERLKAVKAAGWASPPGHPDVDPPHESLQLAELYREAARLPAVASGPASLRAAFAESEAAARELEAALRAKEPPRAAAAFASGAAHCTRCHAAHRDQPGRRPIP